MEITEQPAPRHIAHDALDRGKSLRRVRLVIHRQKNAGHDLNRQHQQCERAEEIPEVEIFGGVIAGDMRFPERGDWKAHITGYYAPKNFNFWYFFGSLALLVLAIQIVTGI